MWAYCKNLGDIGVRIRKEERGTLVVCDSCGFQREDRVSTARLRQL